MINQDDPSIEPLAFFGGTFDPVHYGHLRCADEAREKLGLKNLYLLPAGTPPHRASPQTTTRQRMDMLQLAQIEFPSLNIDDREIRREGPSYMVETLQELRGEFPQHPLLLLVGQDAANLLHTWFHWQQLFSLAHIVILTRPSIKIAYRQDVAEQIQRRLHVDPQKLLCSQAGGVLQLEVVSIDVSATNIKKHIQQGRSLGSMMPPAVIDYINENQLYLPA
jgi:nicotinate-nucleotide adenylyltransferase